MAPLNFGEIADTLASQSHLSKEKRERDILTQNGSASIIGGIVLLTRESPEGKMRRELLIVSLCVALLAGALPLIAHHSFAAEYDSNKPIKFTGKVTKVEWLNPHIYVYVDAKDEGGKDRKSTSLNSSHLGIS